jgi:hypothetical protein
VHDIQNTIMSSTNSIFIPFVYDNLSEAYIHSVIEDSHIGEVERIDFVNKRDEGQNHHAIYIHFKERSYFNNGFWESIDADKCVKLVYSEPWYWKCLKPRARKPARGRNEAPRIRIVLPDDAPAMSSSKATPEDPPVLAGVMVRAVSAGGFGSGGPVAGVEDSDTGGAIRVRTKEEEAHSTQSSSSQADR